MQRVSTKVGNLQRLVAPRVLESGVPLDARVLAQQSQEKGYVVRKHHLADDLDLGVTLGLIDGDERAVRLKVRLLNGPSLVRRGTVDQAALPPVHHALGERGPPLLVAGPGAGDV